MRTVDITIPELGLIAGTRGILGAGVGLLLADRLSKDQRKATGWALLLVGAISTIPLALNVFGRCGSKTRERAIREHATDGDDPTQRQGRRRPAPR
ncbi:MAG: hypothetical protein IT427_17275 [Pirellulales bacterium]|nr:hypothetical protein [Pirellulales bacterium]